MERNLENFLKKTEPASIHQQPSAEPKTSPSAAKSAFSFTKEKLTISGKFTSNSNDVNPYCPDNALHILPPPSQSALSSQPTSLENINSNSNASQNSPVSISSSPCTNGNINHSTLLRSSSSFGAGNQDQGSLCSSYFRTHASVNPYGTKIGEDHKSYVLMYDMLTGIRTAVSRNEAKGSKPLQASDFKSSSKLVFDINGNELTPSSKYDFKFKDYCPWVFKELRKIFKIDAADYLVSLTGKYVLSEVGSPGKSGSFFYYSQDYRFIIKTIRHTEHKVMRKALKNYHEHVKNNPNTLLSRFFGLHRVKLSKGKKIHFVVMGNIFPLSKDIHEIYDLKGSTLGRQTTVKAITTNLRAVRKDLNWLRSGRSLVLDQGKKETLMDQLMIDCDFLQKNNIMDYSLLVGIHNVHRGNREKIRDKSLSVFETLHSNATAANERDQQASSSTEQNSQRKKLNNNSSKKSRIAKVKAKITRKFTGFRRPVQEDDQVALDDSRSIYSYVELPAERRFFKFYREEGGFFSSDDHGNLCNEIYFFGIIDILTPYSYCKRVEHVLKSLCHDPAAISAIDPKMYNIRFMEFMKACVLKISNDIERPVLCSSSGSSHNCNYHRFQNVNVAENDVPCAIQSSSINDDDHAINGVCEYAETCSISSVISQESSQLGAQSQSKKAIHMRKRCTKHLVKMMVESEYEISLATTIINSSKTDDQSTIISRGTTQQETTPPSLITTPSPLIISTSHSSFDNQ